ncbi:ATP-binding protein [Labrys monachus]|uniref:Serine/threonine-protein kinase RsbW n=1 Tax=Labrys monachus TaxID=217067 RepID=A0ABU0F957_9HYPH|nr:ATP-binding protein [Labrys monachus]MDQ0391153.1 serine/threonine-protein kinase RsbW [Labrys monachus]
MPSPTLVIRLEPSVAAVPDMLDRVEAYAEASELPPKTAYRLAVVCEELVANVAMHGAGGEDGATYVEIRAEREADRLRLSVEDDGRPFDPLAAAAPDVSLALDDRDIGGLGIHFVRSLVQEIAYERREGRNCLTALFEMV